MKTLFYMSFIINQVCSIPTGQPGSLSSYQSTFKSVWNGAIAIKSGKLQIGGKCCGPTSHFSRCGARGAIEFEGQLGL